MSGDSVCLWMLDTVEVPIGAGTDAADLVGRGEASDLLAGTGTGDQGEPGGATHLHQQDRRASSMEVVRAMRILRLIVILEEVTPSVSRTLMVPSDLRLDRLHLVLQAAMGWENQHLYSFEAGPSRWSLPDPHLGLGALPATTVTLQDALGAVGKGLLVYTYDFGDNWRHRLTAELTDDPLPGQPYPRPVEAEGRCPPEDVGGPPGYEHFFEAIADPGHPDHDELVEWHDGPFDPSVPDTDIHQLEVLKLAKRWQPRKK